MCKWGACEEYFSNCFSFFYGKASKMIILKVKMKEEFLEVSKEKRKHETVIQETERINSTGKYKMNHGQI